LFGAEPQVSWTIGEKKEFEEHSSARLRTCVLSALRAAAALLINILIIIPFLDGHRLHNHGNFTRYLLFTAMALFLLVRTQGWLGVGLLAEFSRYKTGVPGFGSECSEALAGGRALP
jgi:hypothetical protein